MKEKNKITEKIIGAAIEVHKILGPGLLEAIYEAALCHEFEIIDLAYDAQVPVPILYKGKDLGTDYRVDLIVENQVVVELKTTKSILPVHEAQLLTYLRLTELSVGLIINFNVPVLKQGIRRRVL